MRPESINYYTTAVLYEFTVLVAQYFGGIDDIDIFVNHFNTMFPSCQRHTKMKMDAQEIALRRQVSCSAAALMTGLWWELLAETHSPMYKLETLYPTSSSVGKSHVLVELNSKSQPSESTYTAEWDGKLTATTDKRHIIPPGDSHSKALKWHQTNSTAKLAANRLSRFDLNSEAIHRLKSYEPELKPHVHQSYTMFLNHVLRPLFLGTL